MLFSLLFTWWWWILKWEGKKSWIFDELTCNQCCQNMCGNLVFIMKFFSELSWHDFISGLLIEYEIITDSLLGNMTWQNYNMIDTKCKNIIILSDFLKGLQICIKRKRKSKKRHLTYFSCLDALLFYIVYMTRVILMFFREFLGHDTKENQR